MLNSITPAHKHNFLFLALLLTYWLTRVISIDNLALFLDEANHLWWARFVWQLQPFLAASDGRLLNVLWMAVFWPFNASVWISRVSVPLVSTVGLAWIIAFLQRTHSTRAAVIAAILYTALPLTFFFERMALADSLSAPFVAAALWAISRCFKPHSLDLLPWPKNGVWAAMGGLALTCASLVKISNLIFLCIPLLAALFLFKLNDWRKAGLLAATIYGACFITLLPSAWVINKIGQSDLGLDLVTLKTSIPLTQLPEQIQKASLTVLTDASFYLPFPIWIIVLIGIGLALFQRSRMAWFVAAALGATVGVLISRSSPAYLESRFLPVYAPLLVLLTGAGLAPLVKRWPPAVLLGAFVVLLLPGWAFMGIGWTHSENLFLPPDDRWQYITGWPSGYGFRDIAADTVDHDQPLKLVTLDLGGWQRLLGYLLGHPTLVTPEIYKPGMSFENAWLLLDRPKDDADLARLNLNLIEIARYPRPGSESAIVVYRVEP